MTFRNQYIEELFQNIKEFRIVKGKISTDPTLYEFEIEVSKKGKVTKNLIRVCAEKADTAKEFRKQFQKIMYYPTVRFTNVEWDDFLCENVKNMKIINAPEESEYVFKAREIFEIICELQISILFEDALNGQALYDHEGNYYITSKKVRDIVDTYGFHIPFNILSSTMTELGLKKEGTSVIRLGKPTRCWSFIPAKIKEMKE